jgi:two-component system sensor histidine kinase YesM
MSGKRGKQVKNGCMRYLSNRMFMLLTVYMALTGAVSLSALVTDPVPGWLPVFMLTVLAAGIFYLVFRVIIPYRRGENRLHLYMEGLTIPRADSATAMTPETEELMKQMREMMSSKQVLSLSKRQAQYLALQNQINPHFLYNTLESIRSEALIGGLSDVADMTEALATFFRYTISKVENLVSVEEELRNCQTYFYIQKYRFGDRLELAVECDPVDRDGIYACRLPKLTMQPILENSIIHGTEMKLGTGHIVISLERTDSRINIRISDDGTGMDTQTLQKMNDDLARSGKVLLEHEEADNKGEKGGIALINVNNRIRLLFGEQYGLHVDSVKGVGTDVEISIPAVTSDRDIRNDKNGDK